VGVSFPRGTAGGEVGVEEVFNAEEERGDSHDVAGDSQQDRCGVGRPRRNGLRGGEGECSSTEGEIP